MEENLVEEQQPKTYVMDMNESEESFKAKQEAANQDLELLQRTVKSNKCMRPSLGTPKEEIMAIHKLKMQMKKARNQQQKPTGVGLPIRENKSVKWEENGNKASENL